MNVATKIFSAPKPFNLLHSSRHVRNQIYQFPYSVSQEVSLIFFYIDHKTICDAISFFSLANTWLKLPSDKRNLTEELRQTHNHKIVIKLAQ